VKTMGQTQTFPLPSRIPVPTSGQLAKLNEMGITIGDEIEGYVLYTMPEGWKMRNNTVREDMPKFVMVDSDDNIRVVVSGVWKEAHDNELWMMFEKVPYTKYVCQEKCETCTSITDMFVMAVFGNDNDEKQPVVRSKMY